jgi:hypothetical protein
MNPIASSERIAVSVASSKRSRSMLITWSFPGCPTLYVGASPPGGK